MILTFQNKIHIVFKSLIFFGFSTFWKARDVIDYWWLWVGEPQEEGYDVDSSKFPLNNLPNLSNQ